MHSLFLCPRRTPSGNSEAHETPRADSMQRFLSNELVSVSYFSRTTDIFNSADGTDTFRSRRRTPIDGTQNLPISHARYRYGRSLRSSIKRPQSAMKRRQLRQMIDKDLERISQCSTEEPDRYNDGHCLPRSESSEAL